MARWHGNTWVVVVLEPPDPVKQTMSTRNFGSAGRGMGGGGRGGMGMGGRVEWDPPKSMSSRFFWIQAPVLLVAWHRRAVFSV
jgi:hypothetical protein